MASLLATIESLEAKFIALDASSEKLRDECAKVRGENLVLATQLGMHKARADTAEALLASMTKLYEAAEAELDEVRMRQQRYELPRVSRV